MINGTNFSLDRDESTNIIIIKETNDKDRYEWYRYGEVKR
jgi:hypothetical protein